jgi:cell wall-associated NlpC family hydrolase
MYIVATTGDRNDLLDAFAATKQQAEADAADLEAAQAEARQQSDGIEAKRAGVLEATEAQRALNERVQGDLADLVRQEQERREAAQRAEAERQSEASSARERAAAEDSTPTSSPAPVDAASNRPAPGSGGGLGVLIAPATPAAPAPSPGAPNGGADGAIAAALGQVGRSSYVWGAASPPNFDCSGLTSWAYRQAGVSLPHYSGSQWNVTRRISRSQLQRGDLVFWGSGGSEHVAIYMGGNQIVHAYGSGRGVQTTALDGWWKPATGYGRIG